MCKIVETKWTKSELEGYIKCNYDQLLYIAKNQFKTITLAGYKHMTITYKASVLIREICLKTRSQALLDKVISYYNKIIYFTALVDNKIYKEGE